MTANDLSNQQIVNLLDLACGDEFTSPEIAEAFHIPLPEFHSLVAGESRFQAGYPYPWVSAGGITSDTARGAKRRYADNVAIHAMRAKGCTLKTIADHFGVSISAVSTALSHRPYPPHHTWRAEAERMRAAFGK